jgi:hypothetical protein
MSDATHGVFLRVIERGTIITRIPAVLGSAAQAKQMHALVGGYFCIAEHFPSPKRAGVYITFYCDDDGIAKELPFNLGLRGNPIFGPIVVTATIGPDTVGLTDEEAVALSDFIRRLQRAQDAQ